MIADSSHPLPARPQKPRYVRVAPGVYRYSPTGTFVERIRLNGRHTWRKLHSVSLKDAIVERMAKRSDHARAKLGLAHDPYSKARDMLLIDVLKHYHAQGCPSTSGRERSQRTLDDEVKRLPRLARWLGKLRVSAVDYALCARYGRARIQDGLGGRAVDLDLWTLGNALQCALRHGLIRADPLAGHRPKFARPSDARHAREVMPESADELHALVHVLFSDRRSEALGWQALFAGLTGLRTSEVLSLQVDPPSRTIPGHVEGETLWVRRSKGGVNPFVHIHPDLAECIAAHRRWLATRWPGATVWIPGKLDKGKRAADRQALTHALGRAAKALGVPHRTAHGLRAFFVTVRRSQGASDEQIAAEIGDATGASIIAQVYGSVPPNWRGKGTMGFRPLSGAPAWSRWTEQG